MNFCKSLPSHSIRHSHCYPFAQVGFTWWVAHFFHGKVVVLLAFWAFIELHLPHVSVCLDRRCGMCNPISISCLGTDVRLFLFLCLSSLFALRQLVQWLLSYWYFRRCARPIFFAMCTRDRDMYSSRKFFLKKIDHTWYRRILLHTDNRRPYTFAMRALVHISSNIRTTTDLPTFTYRLSLLHCSPEDDKVFMTAVSNLMHWYSQPPLLLKITVTYSSVLCSGKMCGEKKLVSSVWTLQILNVNWCTVWVACWGVSLVGHY
jgi:hypothetical protein